VLANDLQNKTISTFIAADVRMKMRYRVVETIQALRRSWRRCIAARNRWSDWRVRR
jgi:hypothetical protein